MTDKIFIGIDPGVNTGVAVWNSTKGRFEKLLTLSFWEAIKFLEDTANVAQEFMPRKIIMEDPNMKSPTFKRKGVFGARENKISQNVGSNKRDAQLLQEKCKSLGFNVVCIAPGANKYINLNAKQFQLNTRCMLQSSQHSRDAAAYVWGL
jgi:hypothetical protein